MKNWQRILLAAVVFLALPLAARATYSLPRQIAEQTHARYDAGLGWVNIPNIFVPNMYGPGLDLKINSQGFRNDTEFSKKVPWGKQRVICSGDSFTLGYGVGQEQSWCAQLESLNPRLQTVNMGQGGYGVDQSYLWFMRESRNLDFNAQLFTFIYADFERMKYTNFFGYEKPLLKVVDGEMVIHEAGPPKQVQLTRFTAFMIWLHRFPFMRETEKFARRFWVKIDDPQITAALPKIFENLKQRNIDKKSKLIAIYLPTQMDRRETQLDEFREYLAKEFARQNITFLDLTDRLRVMDEAAYRSMFLTPEEVHFAGAEGHYTKEGNGYVAKLIYEALKKENLV